MKKILLSVFIGMLCFSLYAQDVVDFIDKGVALHDQGDYTGALSNYEEALKIDKHNVTALAEKAYSLLALKDYSNSIKTCQLAISKNPKSKGLKYVYTTYANALDSSKKPNKALKIYDQGIALFPDYYQLHFNKAITLAGLQNYDEALLSFQNSVSLNPKHGSSHNALGRILIFNKANIPALLAFSRFLIIEPTGRRAESNLPFVKDIMSANVEKTGENSITINLDPNQLGKTSKKENDFSTTDLILSMSAALDYDKKNKDKTEVELFMDKFETVCESLKEIQEDHFGFYWDYYVPYYIAMKDKDLIETFSYLVFASTENKKTQDWLAANQTKVDVFYKWSSEYQWTKQ